MSEKTFSRSEVVRLFQSVDIIQKCGVKLPFRFSHCLSMNKRRLQDVVESIAHEEKTKLDNYNKAKEEIALEYCDKDEGGNPVMLPGGYSTKENGRLINAKIKELNLQNKEIISEYEEYMGGEEKIDLYTFEVLDPEKDIPDLEGNLLDGIFPIIKMKA